MVDYSLPAAELADLRSAHRGTRDKREADRIKAVILLASAGARRILPTPC
jgi:hypothetical protein